MSKGKPFKSLLNLVKPETAHNLAISALQYLPFCFPKVVVPDCSITVWNQKFSNPLGLAAGFDKNAEALTALSRFGFGFIEVGTVTLEPQIGNDKPRIFRDENTNSVINRMGFPSVGLNKFKKNLQKHMPFSLPVGVNIGKNKNTEGLEAICNDYKLCVEELSAIADYFVVNVSSPNTAGLRDLQTAEALTTLLSELVNAKQKNTPLLVKIAPDLDFNQLSEVAEVIIKTKCDGVIISNTTITRPENMSSDFSAKQGGLSGSEHLRKMSTKMIGQFYHMTNGKVPIVGVGGVSSGQDMYDKMCAGASLVQLYTAFVFEGVSLIPNIMKEFSEILQKNNVTNCADIIGMSSTKYL